MVELLQLIRELSGPSGLHDLPVDEDVNVVRLDVVQDPLVMRDHDRAHGRADELLDAARHDLERVDVEARVDLVEHRQPCVGFSIAICRISTRFFSPPENPSLR